MNDRDELAALIREWLIQNGDYNTHANSTDEWVRPGDVSIYPADLADAILAAGWRAPFPDREHLWVQWNAEVIAGKRARTSLNCARCGLWYSSWHGDNDCPDD